MCFMVLTFEYGNTFYKISLYETSTVLEETPALMISAKGKRTQYGSRLDGGQWINAGDTMAETTSVIPKGKY